MSHKKSFGELFDEITSESGIGTESVRAAFDGILAGEWTPVQIAGFVVALRSAGESATTIRAAAEAMRAAMIPVEHDFPKLLDTCGTGGDGSGTVNLSTGAAIIAAGCGVVVAKHGNRAVSSKAGSADVLEALGIPTDLPPAEVMPLLKEAGIAFMIAPSHHPCMRHAGPARKELGIRTIFNCLGPLANPARAPPHLLGAYADHLRPVLAETLKGLGTERAWVVRGQDGLDELSPYGPTHVSELADGKIREFTIGPEEFGLPLSPAQAAVGGDAEQNAQIMRALFAGKDIPSRNAFVLNAAAALVVSDSMTPTAATQRVVQCLDSGDAAGKLESWRSAATKRSSSTSS